MEWKDLERINKGLETIDVKNKNYVQVDKRVMAFRELEPNGSITSEIVSNDGGVVVMKATVCGGDGNILGTGYAYEKETASYINKTSYIENCETSAVGRALGFCGIGIDGSIASAEEVANAILNQNKEEEPKQGKPKANDNWDGNALATESEKKIFLQRCEKLGVDYKQISKQAGATSMKTMTKEQHGKALIILGEIEEGKKE